MSEEKGPGSTLDDAAKAVKAAKQVASTVKGAVKAGKAVAGIAAGAGTMGIGTVLMLVWEHKDLLFKILIGVCFVCVIMAVIAASFPMVLFHWGRNSGNTANGDQQTLSAYNNMKSSMTAAADAEHTRLLKEIMDDAQKNGYVLLNTSENSSDASSKQGQSSSSSSSSDQSNAVSGPRYFIADNYKGVGSNDVSLAVCCYSVSEGNDDKADPSQFNEDIKKNITKFFTYTKTQATDSDGNILMTYSIKYDEAVSQRIFHLSDDQYNDALQLAVNTQTLIDELNGKGSSGGVILAETGDNGMGVSDSLVQFIKDHEGFSPTPYRGVDSWNLTIGYGHVIEPGENYAFLTEDQATDLLKQDLAVFIASVDKEFQGVNLRQSQIDALVSLCYNLGPNIWGSINLTNDVKTSAPADVIKRDFEALDHVKGTVVLGLLRRRDAEYEMYEYGYYLNN